MLIMFIRTKTKGSFLYFKTRNAFKYHIYPKIVYEKSHEVQSILFLVKKL